MQRRWSVLIVADDHEVRASLANVLLVAAFDVHLAASGCAALGLLDRQRIDAVVVDVMMPRLDGVGVVRALLARPEHRRPRVLFVIAAHGEIRRHLSPLDVRRVFPKPPDCFRLAEELGKELSITRPSS